MQKNEDAPLFWTKVVLPDGDELILWRYPNDSYRLYIHERDSELGLYGLGTYGTAYVALNDLHWSARKRVARHLRKL